MNSQDQVTRLHQQYGRTTIVVSDGKYTDVAVMSFGDLLSCVILEKQYSGIAEEIINSRLQRAKCIEKRNYTEAFMLRDQLRHKIFDYVTHHEEVFERAKQIRQDFISRMNSEWSGRLICSNLDTIVWQLSHDDGVPEDGKASAVSESRPHLQRKDIQDKVQQYLPKEYRMVLEDEYDSAIVKDGSVTLRGTCMRAGKIWTRAIMNA